MVPGVLLLLMIFHLGTDTGFLASEIRLAESQQWTLRIGQCGCADVSAVTLPLPKVNLETGCTALPLAPDLKLCALPRLVPMSILTLRPKRNTSASRRT